VASDVSTGKAAGSFRSVCARQAGLFLLVASGCGASLADVKPLIDACQVTRIEHLHSGTFVVERAPGVHGTSDGATEPNEHRIRYGGDEAELTEALQAVAPRCGEISRLVE